MKKILSLSLFCFLLTACSSDLSHKKNQDHMNMDDHMGCQEGEIVNGECTVAKDGEKNTDLFANLDSLDVTGKHVPYMGKVQGYLAQPRAKGTYPGVVMIHEWWGLNDNIRDMAKLLANEGYVVLAVDIYEGAVAETSEEAGKLAGAARENVQKSVANMRSAVAYLQTLPNVQKDKIGSMGWCFGGQQSLNLALASDDLAGTVIYYGNLTDNKEQLQNINWPVLGIFGAEDGGIPVESVKSFETALNELEIKNNIHIYPGVGHAFANPSGSRYAPKETLDAWKKTVDFLNTNLGGESMTYDQNSWKIMIPDSCLSFSDGCNTCRREAGNDLAACTRKFCQQYEKPTCLDEKKS